MKPSSVLAVIAVSWIAMVATARAQVIWSEFTQSDLSDDRFAPTPLAISEGHNLLLGLMGGDLGGGNIDRDYYSITVPQGFVLSQLVLQEYFSADPFAFLGIQPGPIFPDDPKTVKPEDLMGWIHLNVSNVGMDVLPLMGEQGQGFVPPLASGVYTFWAQQLGDPTDYTLDFVVTPAPGAMSIFAVSASLLVRRRRSCGSRR